MSPVWQQLEAMALGMMLAVAGYLLALVGVLAAGARRGDE